MDALASAAITRVETGGKYDRTLYRKMREMYRGGVLGAISRSDRS